MVQQPSEPEQSKSIQAAVGRGESIFFVLGVRAVSARDGAAACEIVAATTPGSLISNYPPEIVAIQTWQDYLHAIVEGDYKHTEDRPSPAGERALDLITVLMDGIEWSPYTLNAIADIIRATGRAVRDPAGA